MVGRCWLGIIVAGILAGIAFGAAEPNSPSQEKRSGWGALNLAKTTLAGTTVYYEKAFEPNLPAFERELSKFVAGRDRASSVIARRGEIIADINRILGVTEPNLAEQERLFSGVAGSFSQTKLTLYLAKATTVKDFLRGGGQLPAFSYDRATDSALYQGQLRMLPGGRQPETCDFWVAIMPDKGFAECLGVLAGFGQALGSFAEDGAIHEVTELALVLRAKPTDPYCRWFSDGFANAITERLVEKYVGKEAAAQFDKDNDPNQYRELEKEINLRYWMMGTYFPYVTEIPQTEKKILHARYAYSFGEARRLIDANGIDCVRKILDRIAAKQSRSTADLLAVIKDVTGQDVEPRLAGYQTFDTAEHGIPKYTGAFQAAQQVNDWEKMIVSVFRVMELRGDVYSGNYLQSFGNIALFLFKMGHEEAGDAVMRRAIDLFAKSPIEHGREAAMETFMLYAIQCRHPGKAEKEADELLRLSPMASMPLTIKMLIAQERGNLAEAKSLAGEIRSRAREQSIPYKLATQVLAIDPNQPKTYN